jgi:hypothetical protein
MEGRNDSLFGIAKTVLRIINTALLFGALLLGVNSAYASEGGGGHYPNGAEGFYAGAVPPEGRYFINYSTHYSSNRFNDGSGNSLIPNFDLKVTANTFRIIHITEKKVFGADWGWHVLVPLVDVDVEMMGRQDSKSGLGDIVIDPFILAWHSTNWHWATGIDFVLPTGSYDKNRLANTGRNYWTLEPLVAFTYLGNNGFEASAKFMYDYNRENADTQVKTGQEFHFDYTLAQTFGPWSLAVGGFYYKQVTDDEVNGIEIDNRGQSLAIGPQVMYSGDGWSANAKWHHETHVKNRPVGDSYWIKLIIPI